MVVIVIVDRESVLILIVKQTDFIMEEEMVHNQQSKDAMLFLVPLATVKFSPANVSQILFNFFD